MRTLKLQFPNNALPTLDTFIKQTKEARVFRRAQAVREVVKGTRMQQVSERFNFTYSAVRKWVHRFDQEGTPGLFDRPRPGQPRKVPASYNSTSIASSIKTRSRMAPSTRSGVVRNWP
jgi:transposase